MTTTPTTSPLPIIGLSGKARAGKDTLAERLARRTGATRMAFADPIRDDVDSLLDAARAGGRDGAAAWVESQPGPRAADSVERILAVFDTHGLPDDTVRATDKTPLVRGLLHTWGACVRDADPGAWIRRTLGAAAAAAAAGRTVIITDVRTPTEAEAVQAAGGTVIRLEVPLEVLLERAAGAVTAEQYSSWIETALDGWGGFDLVIDGTLSPEDVETVAAGHLGLLAA